MSIIKFKRGLKASLPVLIAGEPALTTDSNNIFVGNGVNNIMLSNQTTSDLTYYVDVVNGNDATGNGTSSNKYQSVNKVLSILPLTINHNIIINATGINYSQVISINGFNGSGTITINGGGIASTAISKITIGGNSCHIKIYNLAIANNTDLSIFCLNSSYVEIDTCDVTTVSSYTGIQGNYSIVRILNTNISNKTASAILSDVGSIIISKNNTGSSNTYGLYATGGGTIAKEGTQPSGTTNEFILNGGVIR